MTIKKSVKPLADIMRPQTLSQFIGQKHLLGNSKFLYKSILNDNIHSFLFWGPPGCGKTTLAKIISNETKSNYIELSAIDSSIKEIKEVVKEAENNLKQENKKTILFLDEIHRFNKRQQDVFLPYIENGTIILICATTENPSFKINTPLLSRLQTLQFHPLKKNDIKTIIQNIIKEKDKWLKKELNISEDVIDYLSEISNGDARISLNILEASCKFVIDNNRIDLTLDDIKEVISVLPLIYDKQDDQHYNLISALHKSLRGSDVQASIYWTVRMLKSGEDPIYILRRLIRFASEDIGIADSNALNVTISAYKSYTILGTPEGELSIIHAVIYLATAPKSNSVYNAYNKALNFVNNTGSYPVPKHLVNAPTQLMKDIGLGKEYKYPYNYPYNYVAEKYFPDELNETEFYKPYKMGFEKEIIKRLNFWHNLKKT